MSALGQKQTFAVQNVMSALPPKADMCGANRDVRFVPKADIGVLCESAGPLPSSQPEKKGTAAGHPPQRSPYDRPKSGNQPWLSGVSRT